jgi:transposase
MSRIKQRAVIHYLTLKNLSLPKITTKLQNVSGTDTMKYSTVSKWKVRFQDAPGDLFDLTGSGRPSGSDLAAPIQSLLQQFPFISCKVLARKLKIRKATCLRVLYDVLHFEKFSLRCVPHSLETDQRRLRVKF